MEMPDPENVAIAIGVCDYKLKLPGSLFLLSALAFFPRLKCLYVENSHGQITVRIVFLSCIEATVQVEMLTLL